MHPLEQTHSDVESLIDSYQIDSSGHQAVTESYDACRRHLGPFVVSIAAQMLPDLHHDANQGNVIVFLGRDGHSFAAATRALDPLFFHRHCKEVVLSRVVAEAAVQDLEINRGEQFSGIESFRQTKGRVFESDINGAYRKLTRYLREAEIPVGHPNTGLTLVDSSLKGTVQELLSATYPQTSFTGRYAFYAASPDDPHPGSKRGYVVNLRPEQTHRGIGTAFLDLPNDHSLTFAHHEALSVIEDTLHGPLDTPRRITDQGPEQRGQKNDPGTLVGFNPSVVPERFRDPKAEIYNDLRITHLAAQLKSKSKEEIVGDNSKKTFDKLRLHRKKLIKPGEVLPRTEFERIIKSLKNGSWPEDLNASPLRGQPHKPFGHPAKEGTTPTREGGPPPVIIPLSS